MSHWYYWVGGLYVQHIFPFDFNTKAVYSPDGSYELPNNGGM